MKLTASEAILRETIRATGLSRQQLRARDRRRNVAIARQAMMFALQQRTTLSTPQIAEFVGLGDHSTVVHGIKKMRHLIEIDQVIHAFVERLLRASTDLDDGEVAGAIFSSTEKTRQKPPPPRLIPKATKAALTIVAKPKPPEPVYERVRVDGDRFMQLDERGECDVQRLARKNMIAGSQRLADAINKVRPAA